MCSSWRRSYNTAEKSRQIMMRISLLSQKKWKNDGKTLTDRFIHEIENTNSKNHRSMKKEFFFNLRRFFRQSGSFFLFELKEFVKRENKQEIQTTSDNMSHARWSDQQKIVRIFTFVNYEKRKKTRQTWQKTR